MMVGGLTNTLNLEDSAQTKLAMSLHEENTAASKGSERHHPGLNLHETWGHTGVVGYYKQGSLVSNSTPLFRTSTSCVNGPNVVRDHRVLPGDADRITQVSSRCLTALSSRVLPSSDLFGQEKPLFMEQHQSKAARQSNYASDAAQMAEDYHEVSRSWTARGEMMQPLSSSRIMY